MHITSGLLCTCSCVHLFAYLGIHWMHHAEIWCVARLINYAFYTGHKWKISASARVQLKIPFKHICSLPLVHRPKGVSLVTDTMKWHSNHIFQMVSLTKNRLCYLAFFQCYLYHILRQMCTILSNVLIALVHRVLSNLRVRWIIFVHRVFSCPIVHYLKISDPNSDLGNREENHMVVSSPNHKTYIIIDVEILEPTPSEARFDKFSLNNRWH